MLVKLGAFLFVIAASHAAPTADAFRFIDLSSFASPVSAGGLPSRQLAVIPKGRPVFHEVPFQVAEPVGLNGIESARGGEVFPAEVTALQVGTQVRRLHFLHSSLGFDRDGTPMTKVIVHYAGGATESFRLGYGVHARAFVKPRLEKKSGLADPNSRVAWAEGDENRRGGEARLFQTAWENPHPGEIITSIDLVSLFSRATPLIFAITAETAQSGLPPNLTLAPKKVFKELNALEDSAYRGELIVRVTDAQEGQALTNAIAGLSITDDEQTYYFGESKAHATGLCRLAYPPRQTVAFHLLVRAPNHLPFVISQSRTNRGEFDRPLAAPLRRGITVGGVVKSPEGKPIAGAEVLIHQVVKDGPREYTRTDYETALTDEKGSWSSSSLPPGFQGFSFQLMHPEYKPALYTMPGFAEPPTNRPVPARAPLGGLVPPRLLGGELLEPLTEGPARPTRPNASRPPKIPLVTTNALLAGTAEMVMQPAIVVSGAVLDTNGAPLPDLEVVFQRNSPFYERKYLRTDAKGSFRMYASEPGEGTLNVFPKGRSPQYEMVSIQPEAAPIEMRLSPPRILRGRVLDRQQRPVNAARIRLEEWQGTTDLVHFETLTDEQGSFTWTGAPPGQVTFYLTKTNYFNMRSSFSGLNDDLTLYLNRAPGVSGKVVDADTKKPIPSFTIIKGRKYSPNDEQIRWERYDTVRGQNGEYTARIQEYYFQPEARIMVEAPGYIPQISPAWQNPDSYVQDFALKKGKGIGGVVQNGAGIPVPNATLVLVDKGANGSLDSSSRFRSGSSNGDFTRTDATGHFEFSPKLEADMVLVADEQGFAEVRAEQLAVDGRIVLKPWGRVKGVMRIGDGPQPERWVRLQNRFERYPQAGQRASALSLYLKADPDDSGNFAFENVPSGDFRVSLEYPVFDRNYGETPLSHGIPVAVKPGETAEVMLGGTGRRVAGNVKVIGGDASDIDWKRDVHRLTLAFTNDALTGPIMSALSTPEERQQAWAEYNKRQREFWNSPAGRARELEERTYVLLFDTNGNFHADNVPPGHYHLQVNPTEAEEQYSRRSLGSASKEVVVPDEPGAKVNQPFDVGAIDLRLQGELRIGRLAPPFEGQTLEGKPIKLADFRGQSVLLYFWASGAISTLDLQILKELQNTYCKDNRLVILGLNLDTDLKTAQQFVKDNSITWPQAFLGSWNQTQVPATFGVQGYPTGLLIGPDGKLVGKQLRGNMLRSAVRNHLAPQTGLRVRADQ